MLGKQRADTTTVYFSSYEFKIGGYVNSWLPLTDYSTKYKVSVSTLRRRIKAEDIHFRFEDGKYFIIDEPVGTHQRVHRPSLNSETTLMGTQAVFTTESPVAQSSGQTGASRVDNHLASTDLIKKTNPNNQSITSLFVSSPMASSQAPVNNQANANAQAQRDEPILNAANKLLNELKKAYSLILQEKEEQILHLKSELADLKTLVRVLESENERLKNS